jgi:hypothetical protein
MQLYEMTVTNHIQPRSRNGAIAIIIAVAVVLLCASVVRMDIAKFGVETCQSPTISLVCDCWLPEHCISAGFFLPTENGANVRPEMPHLECDVGIGDSGSMKIFQMGEKARVADGLVQPMNIAVDNIFNALPIAEVAGKISAKVCPDCDVGAAENVLNGAVRFLSTGCCESLEHSLEAGDVTLLVLKSGNMLFLSPCEFAKVAKSSVPSLLNGGWLQFVKLRSAMRSIDGGELAACQEGGP